MSEGILIWRVPLLIVGYRVNVNQWTSLMSNVLYLDCASGIAGDMLVAALLDAGGDWLELDRKLKTLPLNDAQWELVSVKKNGFAAKQFQVSFPPQHAHRHLSDIEKIIAASSIGERAAELAMKLFLELGQAEARVHGSDLKKVHFHEVGAIDSIVDIVSIAILLDQLQINQVLVSSVCTGYGSIEIAHGQVAVPAPATALLLCGFPVYAGDEPGEMVTPTGAAFLSAFAKPVDGLPLMQLHKTGSGAGTKDLKTRANIIRVYVGAASIDGPTQDDPCVGKTVTEELLELQFQVDDMTGQQLAHLQTSLFAAGVNDCFLTSVLMKKGRPGVLVTVHCTAEKRFNIENLIFANSSSIGIRAHRVGRTILKREAAEIESSYGRLAAKRILMPDGSYRTAVEFDELQRVAGETGQSLLEIQSKVAINSCDGKQ